MKKQPERTARTRQKLVDAFCELYREKKIEKITIKEIAEKAGVYRSTFYEYFSDIYELLTSIEDDIMEDFRNAWEHFFRSNDFETGISYILKFYEVNGEKVAVLLGPNAHQSFYLRIKDTAREVLFSNTKADKSDPRIEILLTALPPAVLSILQYWYEHQDPITLQETLAVGKQFMTKGVLPALRDLGVLSFENLESETQGASKHF